MLLKIKNVLERYGAHLVMGAVAITIVGSVIFGGKNTVENRPQTASEYAKTSAMILALNERSGGSGVILQSTPAGSIILTNKHVCQLIQVGGYVKTLTTKTTISAYKVFASHDLCLIKVLTNLGVNTTVATSGPAMFSRSHVSGHPHLLPAILTDGYFSDYMTVQVVVGSEPCTGEEDEDEALICVFMRAKPIVRSFYAQVTSSTILPGSSGSAVFNDNGEISGLVFAGNGDSLSYGLIVPHEYVKEFLDSSKRQQWQVPRPMKNPPNLFATYAQLKAICEEHQSELANYCNKYGFHQIWTH